MPQPPRTPPHSDIEGVARDERRNTEAATEVGQGASDLERARKESVGRPPELAKPEPTDDRSG